MSKDRFTETVSKDRLFRAINGLEERKKLGYFYRRKNSFGSNVVELTWNGSVVGRYIEHTDMEGVRYNFDPSESAPPAVLEEVIGVYDKKVGEILKEKGREIRLQNLRKLQEKRNMAAPFNLEYEFVDVKIPLDGSRIEGFLDRVERSHGGKKYIRRDRDRGTIRLNDDNMLVGYVARDGDLTYFDFKPDPRMYNELYVEIREASREYSPLRRKSWSVGDFKAVKKGA